MTHWLRMGTCALTLVGGAAFASGGSPQYADLGGPPYEVEEIQEAPKQVEPAPPSEVEEIETHEVKVSEHKKGGAQSGPYILIGGGVDGFSRGLSNEVNTGPTWGATAGVTGPRLGFELGYSGSANEVNEGVSGREGGAGSGADIVRNGGQAAVTLNLTKTALHPYILGGIGLEHYAVRNGESLGFNSDTGGYVPAAAGLRWNIGSRFTADARFSYNFLFSDDFAPGDPGGDRLQGLLTLGGTL